MRRIASGCAVLLCMAGSAFAQSPEQEVRNAENAMIAAAKAGDKAAFQRLYAEELRWLDTDSGLLDKQRRLAEITPNPAFNRDFRTEIRIYDNIAVEAGTMAFTRNGEAHADPVLRVYIKRNGQWQLLSHAAVAVAK